MHTLFRSLGNSRENVRPLRVKIQLPLMEFLFIGLYRFYLSETRFVFP